jgi:hypothetical protein
MGAGYWVWLIPLAGGMTSIGIVADPRIHPLSEYNSFDRAMAWLRRHEPECASRIGQQGGEPMDFLAVKNIAYGCKQLFSSARWALTGEAGVFLDPFYSPGSDFIAMSNTLICELIERDLRGRPIAALARAYDEFYLEFFRNSVRVYENQYPLFGNQEVMTAKVVWDYAVYWTFPAFLFIQGRLTEPSTLSRIRPATSRIGRLNAQMQAFFRQWNRMRDKRGGQGFIDQSRIAPLRRLNGGLTDELDVDAFHDQFDRNVELLEDLAAEMTGRAVGRHPSLAVFASERKIEGERLGELWR